MTISQNFKTAFKVLNQRKGRSALTMLGIIIGISAFILINSVGAGAQELILGQIKKIGSNLVVVLPGATSDDDPPASVFGINITTLKEEDIDAVAKAVPHVMAAAGYVRGSNTISFESENKLVTFMGVGTNYLSVEEAEVASGRFFTKEENSSIAKVVVLGSQLATELFNSSDPIEKQVKIGNNRFRVVGVMKERGSAAFENQDDTFFLPLKTAQKIVLGINYLSAARVKIDDAKNIPEAKLAIAEVVREKHRIRDPKNDDFSVKSTDQVLGVLTTVTDALTMFLTAIGAIALIVGGIGIMNIMYVSVSERTFEIGLRKAVGARNRNILTQFLTEAVVLTFIAGTIGIIIGALFSYLISVGAGLLGYEWSFILPIDSVFIAFIIATAIGIIFGLRPASRASKLSPIEAIRGV